MPFRFRSYRGKTRGRLEPVDIACLWNDLPLSPSFQYSTQTAEQPSVSSRLTLPHACQDRALYVGFGRVVNSPWVTYACIYQIRRDWSGDLALRNNSGWTYK